MPASALSLAASTSSDNARRRRAANACISCRDRRVKCNHARPACFQCAKRGRECQYPDPIPTTVEFVTEPLTHPPASRSENISPSETWESVIEKQVDLVKKANIKPKSPRTGASFWTLAQTQEPGSNASPRSGIRISALGEWSTSILATQLPSRETCDRLLQHFLFSIHPVIPVCHVPTLKQEYAWFWESLSPATSVDSLVQILSVLCTAAANSTLLSDVVQSSSLHNLYEDVLRAVESDAYHTPSTSVQFLQGYVIMSTFRASQSSPFFAFRFLPRAIRYAQSLQLHVDQRTWSPVEKEVGRRLWWHLIALDVESTIASGLQGIIRPDGYTTGLPSAVCDEAILGDEASQPTDVPQTFSLMTVAVQGYWQWAQRMQTWFEEMPDQNEVTRFGQLIESSLGLISECEENEWARTFLKMQVDRAYCMLGLRFWQLDQFKGTDCHCEVITTCRSFLQKYLHLSNLSAAQGLSWFVPGFIQPFHALVILLLHLRDCSHWDEETWLSQGLVDQIFQLRVNHLLRWSDIPIQAMMTANKRDGATLPKSNPRYRMLWNLRENVWQKLGWPIPIIEEAVRESWQKDTAMQQRTVNEDNIGKADASVDPTTCGDQANIADNSMADVLDNLLNNDPMDLLDWHDWESASDGVFANQGTNPGLYGDSH